MMDRLADLLAGHRWAVALAVAVLSLVAIFGLRVLEVDDVPRNLFDTEHSEFKLLQGVYGDFGSDENVCVVVIEAADLFTPQVVSLIRSMVGSTRRIEGVHSVRSIDDAVMFDPGQLPRTLLPAPDAPEASFAKARREALAHPLLAGQLIAADAQTTLVLVRLADELIAVTDMAPVIERVRAVIREHTVGSIITAKLTGLPVVRVELYQSILREQIKVFQVGGLIGLTIAFLVFRRVAAVLIVYGGAFVGALWTMGALGLAGEPVNALNSILPTLVLVVGLTDAVHLMYDIRASHRRGAGPVAAACSAVRHVGPACVLTSITTAIGFSSLALTSVPIIRRFGPACGVGVALALAAVLMTVPLLASTRLCHFIHRNSAPDHSAWTRFCHAWTDAITHRARWVSVIGVGATLLFVWTALQLKPDSRLTESIPPNSETAQGLYHVDKVFGGFMPALMLVEWSEDLTFDSPRVLDSIAAVKQLFIDEPATKSPLSVLDLLDALPGAGLAGADRVPYLQFVPEELRNRFVRPNLRRALVTAHVQDLGTAAFEPACARLQQGARDIERRFPGIRLRLTGMSVVATRQLNLMIGDLAASLGLAAIVIFGVMTVALRSFRLGMLTLLPNIFPLAFAAAYLVWTGRHLEMTSVIVFSICLGVAVDDTIHFTLRFRRELATDGNVNSALARTLTAVGAAMVTTTAILVGGFAAAFVTDMPSMHLFAELACVALCSALVGDLVILPALLASSYAQ